MVVGASLLTWDLLRLRYQFNTEVGKSNQELDRPVWGSSVRPRSLVTSPYDGVRNLRIGWDHLGREGRQGGIKCKDEAWGSPSLKERS